MRSFPGIADALAGATLDAPLRGMLDQPAYFRRSFGPGWALAGDAAHHKDPILARGITDAFRDADLLAAAISSSFGDNGDLLPALEQYHQQREAASWRVNELNHRLAELPRTRRSWRSAWWRCSLKRQESTLGAPRRARRTQAWTWQRSGTIE